MEQFCRAGQAADVNMAHAHCILDTGYKHTLQYVIIIAFLQQQYLHGRASMLRYMYMLPSTGRQHRGGCITPQAVTHSLVLLKMGKIISRNMLS